MFQEGKNSRSFIAGGLIFFVVGFFVASYIITGNPVAVLSQANRDTVNSTKLLNEITGIVDRFFYKDIDNTELIHNAAKSIMYSTGDKYAAYFTKEEYQQYKNHSSGEYFGLGIVIKAADGEVIVTNVYEGSPAFDAGLLEGDILISVNGESLAGLQVDEAIKLIAKKNEAPVNLTINRDGKQIDFVVKWGVIHTPKGSHRMIGDVMYARLLDFNGDCVERIKNAITDARALKAKGFILDLRGNPGGDLAKVVDISKMFIGKGVILTIRTRDQKTETFESDGERFEIPLVLLVNGGSASASEVLSGAVKDHGIGTLIGERTFGKGIVQTIFPLKSDGGHVRLTTSTYYTPSGQCIHEIGIEPDITVNLDEGEHFGMVAQEDDNQLQAALSFLNK